jgi:hypothetical protein
MACVKDAEITVKCMKAVQVMESRVQRSLELNHVSAILAQVAAG